MPDRKDGPAPGGNPNPAVNPDAAANIVEVLNGEMEQVDARRHAAGLADGPPPEETAGTLGGALRRARERRLVGLAFSGGGIRSATFNLGLLQGLAGMGLLRFIDYLSTVSGGGYIGGWLAACVRRCGGVASVEKQLGSCRGGDGRAGAGEAPALQHLRRHGNYLAPRTGFLSADRWVLWATYLRNFLLGQLVLLPTAVAVLLIARVCMVLYHPLPNWGQPPPERFIAVGLATSFFLTAALAVIFRAAGRVKRRQATPEPAGGDAPASPREMLRVTLLLLFAAILFCVFVPYRVPIWPEPRITPSVLAALEQDPRPWTAPEFSDAGLEHRPWAEAGLSAAYGALVAVLAYSFGISSRVYRGTTARSLLTTGVVVAGGVAGGLMLYGVYRLLNTLYHWDGQLARDYIQARATARLAAFGPPAVLASLVLAFFLGVGLAKRRMREEAREWWSSLCARLLLAALVWTSVNLVALYGTAFVLWAGPWTRAALGSGWLLTVAAGVLAGGGGRTDIARPRKPTTADRVARLAPHVFVIGLLIAVSLLIHVAVDNPPDWSRAPDAVWARDSVPERPAIKVTTTRVTPPGDEGFDVERRDSVEREEVIDEGAIVSQMYWLGILNSEPGLIPSVSYRISYYDLNRLHREGATEQTLQAVRPMADDVYPERKAFFAELDLRIPHATYDERYQVIRYAKDVRSLEFDRLGLLAKLGLCLGGCVLLMLAAAWRVDVNLFSLHALYGNRLTRAYLGASRAERTPDPVTGLDPDDDLLLADLRGGVPGAGEARPYDGPCLIVNTAMNLVRGDELAWQERMAESFVLTARHCGSETTGYRPTRGEGAEGREGYGRDITLGTAVTISGAAASPNMGYNSSPSVTALLTVFNARLGAWLGNPARETWRRAGPLFGFVHLFKELFGWTDDKGPYVYLSDGGHFENLAVYELVRRRCQYVIVADAGCDPEHAFQDLGNLIRKVRTDFGIRIQIDLGALRKAAADRTTRWHCSVGKIRYDDIDPDASPGTLVYVKPSLTGDEPADVLHYAERYPDFPHESTGDQFFSESQFESYRKLGQHAAESVFAQAVAEMNSEPGFGTAGERHRRRCRALFSSVVRRWFAMPPEYETTFLNSTRDFVAVQEAFRQDPRLCRLTHDLYPELMPGGDPTEFDAGESDAARAARRAAEFHIILQMLKAMENAWMSLNLDVHYAHPLNRGWMDIFHRWSSSRTVREHWPVVRAEFGRGFVKFCEKQMRMGEIDGEVVPFDGDELPEVLVREFRAQWPHERGLDERLPPAREAERRLAWLVYPSVLRDAGLGYVPAERVPCGIILMTPEGTGEGAPAYELLAWMRGAYRNIGMGRPAVRRVLGELRDAWRHEFRLVVRLPVTDLSGPGGKLQRGMWLTFFHHHEFVRVESVQSGGGVSAEAAVHPSEIVLERCFPARPESPDGPVPPSV